MIDKKIEAHAEFFGVSFYLRPTGRIPFLYHHLENRLNKCYNLYQNDAVDPQQSLQFAMFHLFSFS